MSSREFLCFIKINKYCYEVGSRRELFELLRFAHCLTDITNLAISPFPIQSLPMYLEINT